MIENKANNRFWTPETIVIIILIALAFVTRFYDLGTRVMSHDEINHVIPSFDLSQGRGYKYDPVTHGPFQFHMMALSYYLLGDSDFAARVPHALFSVATVVIALTLFRRYLGKVGSLAAGIILLISPYMVFYGRYARNEAFIVVWAMLIIYSILRFLEKGDSRALFLFTAANALHFTDKATSYIFAGMELIFLTAYLVYRLTRMRWPDAQQFRNFLVGLMLALVGLGGAAGLYITQKPATGLILGIIIALGIGGLAALVFSIIALLRGLGWKGIRSERSFDLLMLLGTLILPLGAAVIVKLTGRNPIEYQESTALMFDAVVIAVLGIIAVILGLWWNRRIWLLHAAIFYIPYILLYTTFFTNGEGLAVGFMGALGYWMEQQGVARGGQPIFYYAFIQIPVYEFLPAIGTIAAFIIGATKHLWISAPGEPFSRAERPQFLEEEVQESADQVVGEFDPVINNPLQPTPTLSLLLFWSIMTLLAFSMAGEKMPWLTIHIALPLCLCAGWATGWLIETIPWPNLQTWGWRNYARIVLLAGFTFLALITIRTSYRAAFINYDYAYEYLVYAHAARDPKTLLKRIEDISERTTGGENIVAAYDNNMRYPYWWYMRRYPNRNDFDKTPTNALRNAPVIMVSPENIGKVQAIVRDNYYSVQMMRLWWHNQDYWNLKWDAIEGERKGELGADAAPMTYGEYFKYVWKHIKPFFTDPAVRHSIWEIWYNRNFSEYAKLRESNSFTLTTWSPADSVTVYTRKDIANQVWNYGNEAVVQVDPYAKAEVSLTPDLVYGTTGTDAGYFQAPRSLAAAPDGTLYITDSRNHRIQHLSEDGSMVLNTWGSFADINTGPADGGFFNEPWGVAVGPDGSVFVTDTWNHRVQKFGPEGDFITMWGKSGLADTTDGFYGPRGIAVDSKGQVFVVDTGNNRVVIFDEDGNYITQFGVPGVNPGEFSEPVGIAVDANGLVYIADTWNKRVQIFTPDASGMIYEPTLEFPVYGWEGQGIDNKPFIAVDNKTAHIFVSDPEACRVLEFTSDGTIFRIWDPCDPASQTPGLPTGLLLDTNGIWVTDAGDNTVSHFNLTP